MVKWSKFAPLGKRGLDSGNADNPYCATPIDRYVNEANEQTFVVVQIEDPEMLGEVDAIAAVEGVDVLFLGPADYSLLSGSPGQFDCAAVGEAIRRVASAAEKAGKVWGMPTSSPERSRQLLDQGARFLTYGADILMVKQALESIRETYGPLGFTFDGRM